MKKETTKRKLIEVGIPLKAINEESAREKSIRHGHPSTLHLWWARRPLAAARAVLFAQLVDDPSSHPDRFPTDEDVAVERKRLHDLMEKLVLWDNCTAEAILAQAHREILNSTGGAPPPILDPFAGGGTIPLEAQRLGLQSYASDLNPVAVLINKALIEIPPKFANQEPVSPEVEKEQLIHSWPRVTGLAEDVRRYGRWMRDEAERLLWQLYPKVSLTETTKSTVIAWIWARTIVCPNPACGIAMPLVRSWRIGQKNGNEAQVVPLVVGGSVRYSISRRFTGSGEGTVSGRTGATCIGCGAHVSANDVHAQLDVREPPSPALIATVCAGPRGRTYVAPDEEQIQTLRMAREKALEIRRSDYALSAAARGTFGGNAQGRRYGYFQFSDYFTDRQLVTLTTLSDLVTEARSMVFEDALKRGIAEGDRLNAGGTGAAAYADAVAVYLGFVVSKTLARNNVMCTWESGMDRLRGSFQRQAITISWDYAEANLLEPYGGGLESATNSVCEVLDSLVIRKGDFGTASQLSAVDAMEPGFVVSTDPPYYDNIGYSDLSDFFYVWLRRSLKSIYPAILGTVLVPKAEELVADAYRHGGKEEARNFFEKGFQEVFRSARESASADFPITVYYAFKQSETTEGGEASTGWESLLEGMVRSNWMVTATWPVRSELGSRMVGAGRNALASSIVLALRPRPLDAPRTDRRRFISALKTELPAALRDLQQGAIAPVDLPQAAIGPGMTVFSRYSAVLEDDGSAMPVRAALARINEVLDEVLTEQEGDFDPDSRFAIAWYRQYGFQPGPYGDADNIARARNASVDHLDRAEILTSRAGKVTLIAPEKLDVDYDPAMDPSISTWEVVMHLTRVLTSGGIPAASALLAEVPVSIERDLCKELAFLLFSIAEGRKETKLAVDFNALGTAWNEIASGASKISSQPVQSAIDFQGD